MYIVRSPWLVACPLVMMACSSAAPLPRPAPPSPAASVPRPSAAPEPTVEALPETAAAPRPDVDLGATKIPAWTPPSGDRDTAACKAIARTQESASRKNARLPADALPMSITPAACFPAGQAAWGLVQTITGYDRNELNAALDPGCGPPDGNPCVYDASLSIVPTYVGGTGAALTGKALLEDTVVDRGPSEAVAGVFDLDGDGAAELLFAFDGSAILTAKDGKVSPYEAAKGLVFEDLVDIDQDGRPDLLLANPYVAGSHVLGCGKRSGAPVVGFLAEAHVVARSLPDGTFSTTDPAAQALAKTACPAKPDPIVVKDATGMYDNDRIRQNVACARMWGVPAQAVIAALDAACKWPVGDDCDALFDIRDGTPIATCAGRGDLVAWADKPAPITLR